MPNPMRQNQETKEVQLSLKRKLLEDRDTIEQFSLALPAFLMRGKDEEEAARRFLRACYTEVLKTPKLMKCTMPSLLGSMITSAQIGIVPIQGLGKAALIPYDIKRKGPDGRWVWTTEAQFQLMTRGMVELARRGGGAIDISAEVVYEADEFELEQGSNRHCHHKPWIPVVKRNERGEWDIAGIDDDRGGIRGAYSMFEYSDGRKPFRFMDAVKIIKIRNRYSKAYQSERDKPLDQRSNPWVTSEEEMFRKTAIKNQSKYEECSEEMKHAVYVDNLADSGVTGEEQGEIMMDLLGKGKGKIRQVPETFPDIEGDEEEPAEPENVTPKGPYSEVYVLFQDLEKHDIDAAINQIKEENPTATDANIVTSIFEDERAFRVFVKEIAGGTPPEEPGPPPPADEFPDEPPPDTEPEEPQEEEVTSQGDEDMDGLIKKFKYMAGSAFVKWLGENLHLFDGAPKDVIDEARAKWERCSETLFPLDIPSVGPEEAPWDRKAKELEEKRKAVAKQQRDFNEMAESNGEKLDDITFMNKVKEIRKTVSKEKMTKILRALGYDSIIDVPEDKYAETLLALAGLKTGADIE